MTLEWPGKIQVCPPTKMRASINSEMYNRFNIIKPIIFIKLINPRLRLYNRIKEIIAAIIHLCIHLFISFFFRISNLTSRRYRSISSKIMFLLKIENGRFFIWFFSNGSFLTLWEYYIFQTKFDALSEFAIKNQQWYLKITLFFGNCPFFTPKNTQNLAKHNFINFN